MGSKRQSSFTPRLPEETKARLLRRIELALNRPVINREHVHQAVEEAFHEAEDVSLIEDHSSVRVLDLPEAILDALIREGIETIGQLQNQRECDLDVIRGLGPGRTPKVRVALEAIGRSLRDPAL